MFFSRLWFQSERPTICASTTIASCLVALSACSPYREVHNARQVSPADRIIVVEVVLERTTVRDQVSGMYLASNIVVDDHIPMVKGRPALSAYSGHEVDASAFGSTGGVVAFRAPRGPLYILGARAASTVVLASIVTLLPFVTWIPPARAQCEYVGTIHVWGPSSFTVRDELAEHWTKLSHAVAGCELVPNIGAVAVQ